MAELRWILSGLGVMAIAAIWWWSTRRSGQAAVNSELRESTVMPQQSLAPNAPGRERPEIRERTISPLEPLSIRTGDFEGVPILDMPMMADPKSELAVVDYIEASAPDLAQRAYPIDIDGDARPVDPADEMLTQAAEKMAAEPTAAARAPAAAARELAAARPAPTAPSVPPFEAPPRVVAAVPTQAPLNLSSSMESSDRLGAAEPPPPNASEQQKIVTLRVCAVGDGRWSGGFLMAALENHGLAFGRYQVYHRKHADGRSIFCVASLIEPGTFDVARMGEDEYRGVSLFAVLPGPVEPLQAVDALLTTARELARDLSGTVQDAKGVPFSPQRIATLREDVARFQAVLSASTRPHLKGPAA